MLKFETDLEHPKTLTPIGEYVAGGKKVIRYRCECGKEFSYRQGKVIPHRYCKECKHYGAFMRKLHPKLYIIWNAMRQRCTNPNIYAYRYYGGRGITVCEEWNNFRCFYEWAIKAGYQEGLSIERIDINKGYCPENCTWIPKTEQSKNTSLTYQNKTLTIDGVTKTYVEWANEAGIPPKRLAKRLSKGMKPEQATKSIIPCGASITIDGETKNLKDWCKEYGISPQAVFLRRQSGMSLIEAITAPKVH